MGAHIRAHQRVGMKGVSQFQAARVKTDDLRLLPSLVTLAESVLQICLELLRTLLTSLFCSHCRRKRLPNNHALIVDTMELRRSGIEMARRLIVRLRPSARHFGRGTHAFSKTESEVFRVEVAISLHCRRSRARFGVAG